MAPFENFLRPGVHSRFNSDVMDGTIGEGDDGSNRFDVFLDLSSNSFHGEPVLSTRSSVGQVSSM